MGLRGPAPTPTPILAARGSWRAKANEAEPKPKAAAPRCPPSLGKEAKSIWRSIIAQLEMMGLLSQADGNQLERYCTYLVRWRACEDFIAKNGISYPLKSDDPSCYVGKIGEVAVVGFAEYPQLRESHRLDKALKQIEAQFGFTPSARTRLRTEAPPADDDPAEAFFRKASARSEN